MAAYGFLILILINIVVLAFLKHALPNGEGGTRR